MGEDIAPTATRGTRGFDESVWAAATWATLFAVQFVVAVAVGVMSLLWHVAGIDGFGPIWYRTGTAIAGVIAAVIAGLAAVVFLLRGRSARARAFGLGFAVAAVIVSVSGIIVACVLRT